MSDHKYSVPDDHWESDEPEGPPEWIEDTSARDVEFDVQLHDEGYQTDERWTIHCTDRDEPDELVALYAIEHTNKGNYWRDGHHKRDAVDFIDLPAPVKRRTAAVLNRDLSEITPDTRVIHREDGTGFGDREGDE